MEHLYCRQRWDKYKCSDYRGVLISGVNLYYNAQFEIFVSFLNTGVSSIERFHCIVEQKTSIEYISTKVR